MYYLRFILAGALLLGASLCGSDKGVIALLSLERSFADIGGKGLGQGVLGRIEALNQAIKSVMDAKYDNNVSMLVAIENLEVLRVIDFTSEESMLSSAATLALQMDKDTFYHLDHYRFDPRVLLEKLRGNLVGLRERLIALEKQSPGKLALSKQESDTIEQLISELGDLVNENDGTLGYFTERDIRVHDWNTFITYWTTNKGEIDELFAINLDQNLYSDATEHDRANKALIGRFNELLLQVWSIIEQAKETAKKKKK